MYRKNDSFGDFSLPTQRCFSSTRSARGAKTLFSAYAEVFPYTDLKAKVKEAFLCLRRGVSPSRPHGCGARRFSLPTQRCFQSKCCRKPPTSLFSAYAEVFLSSTALSPSTGTFLCLRRGVSQAFDQPITPPGFSLPTQRCFSRLKAGKPMSYLFSAYAEVFPIYRVSAGRRSAFLCLRRGVSCRATWYRREFFFSLPTQRCFVVSGCQRTGSVIKSDKI